MSRAVMLKRLAAIATRYAAEAEPITFVIYVTHFVDETDPRCGTWEPVEDEIYGFAKSIRFYGRSLEHCQELASQYEVEEKALLMRITEPKGPIQTTNVYPNYKERKA